MTLNDLVNEVRTIAEAAGAKILEIYADESSFQVEQKSDDSPLTIADKSANAIICDGLEKLKAQYPIISEENKAIPYQERKNFERYWLVDPLDGTKEFIKRNGEFTVNIALIEDNQPILGVVYVPVTDEMFWATKEGGAFHEKDEVIQKLDAPNFKLADSALGIVCSRSHMNDTTKAFVGKFDAPNLVAKGSSLKFLILASGEAHVYPRLAPTMEWDTGAAQIILEEAGGSVINNETKTALSYNKENLLNPHFIAYGNVDNLN